MKKSRGEVPIISSDEDLITPERMAKGDLDTEENSKGFIRTAIPKKLFVIDKLIYNGLLEPHHEIYGVGFLELRSAFRAPWAARVSAILMEQFGKGVSISKATEIYQNICRGINSKGIEVIQYALEIRGNKESETQSLLMRYEISIYQEYFNKLVSHMDEERERIYREQKEIVERQLNKK